MKILWVIDSPNWAYDINAKNLSRQMKRHQHDYAYVNGNPMIDTIGYDKVILMYPPNINRCLGIDWGKLYVTLNSERMFGGFEIDLLSKVNGVICANKCLEDLAKKQNTNTLLIPEGLDLNIYNPQSVLPCDKGDVFTVGFAGNIEGAAGKYKGWDIYQRAFTRLDAAFPNKVKQWNVGPGNTLLSKDEMVERFYRVIDCFVLLSLGEGCSSVVMESLACGIPVVCSKVGFHGEHLVNGTNVIFCGRNPEEVFKAFSSLYLDKEFRNKIRLNGRRFAQEYHDIQENGSMFAAFIEKGD